MGVMGAPQTWGERRGALMMEAIISIGATGARSNILSMLVCVNTVMHAHHMLLE